MNIGNKPLLAIVAGDPGGGAALAPVVMALQAQHWPHRLYAYAESHAAWAARGWQLLPAEQIDLTGVAGVLCATSVNAQMHELRWIAAATGLGVPSVSVLDFWSNYWPRFELAGEHCLPTRIAVMDHLARDEMSAAGFDGGRLVVTGQPALDRLADVPPLSPQRRQAIRDACGVAADQLLLLFVSQPLRRLAVQMGVPAVIDEQAALVQLERALAQWANPVALRVKPHPRENRADFAAIGQIWPDTKLAPDELAHELLMSADIVVGIHSMMLFEACHLGCRVVSFQPGLRAGDDPLPSNRAGWSWRCDDPDLLVATLEQALNTLLPTPPALDGQSAQRIITTLECLIQP